MIPPPWAAARVESARSKPVAATRRSNIGTDGWRRSGLVGADHALRHAGASGQLYLREPRTPTGVTEDRTCGNHEGNYSGSSIEGG